MIDVIVVDDHPIMVAGIVEVFKGGEDGINISGVAYSAKEALKLLKKGTADVMIVDLGMPGLNGAELCLALKNMFPGMKIIIFDGENDVLMLKSAWLNGADAIISKYSNKEDLIKAIRKVVNEERYVDKNVVNVLHHAGEMMF